MTPLSSLTRPRTHLLPSPFPPALGPPGRGITGRGERRLRTHTCATSGGRDPTSTGTGHSPPHTYGGRGLTRAARHSSVPYLGGTVGSGHDGPRTERSSTLTPVSDGRVDVSREEFTWDLTPASSDPVRTRGPRDRGTVGVPLDRNVDDPMSSWGPPEPHKGG